jgi:superfamily II DNA or RNA helicase
MLHVGPKIFEDKKQALIPRVHFERTPIVKKANGFEYQGRLNIAKLVTHLSKLPDRQKFVQNLITDAYERGRKILVLSERKAELKSLDAMSHFLHGRESCGLCVGELDGRSMTQEERQQSLAKPIILATAQLVKEGLDKKDIDTLIIVYPQSSESFSEQSVGRILRVDDEKKHPVVVVLVDYEVYIERANGEKIRPFAIKARKMEQTFRRLRYKIIQGV